MADTTSPAEAVAAPVVAPFVIDGETVQPGALYDVQFSEQVEYLGSVLVKQERHHIRGAVAIELRDKVAHLVKSTLG